MHVGKTSSSDSKKYPPGSFMGRLKERKIIATLAAFIGGGWLTYEVVHWILVDHYHLPKMLKDITIVTFLGALLSTVIWRWFRGAEKRLGNVKVEVLVVPLIILLTLVIDLRFIFVMTGISINMLLIGIVALCLGIAWVVFKSLQWATSVPELEKKVEVLEPIEEKSISFPETKCSIVVLPFVDMSPDRNNEYFSDGLTEEIITDLSQIRELCVISRNSAMTLKGTNKSTITIGKELNVQYVLEGSVRKAENDLRITAQLIDAETDIHLWAEKYSGTLDDVFDIQEKVSRSIVDELKLKLSPKEIDKLAERSIDNVQAYDFYLRARQDYLTLKEEGMDRAVKILKNGLNMIGDNVTLYMGLADVHYWYYEMNYKHDETTLQKAWEYTEKVLALEPDSAMGYYLLGRYEKFHGNAKKACQHINRAVSIDPNIVSILEQAVWMNSLYMGKPHIAKPLAKRLLEIDPLTPLNYCAASFVPWVEGRFDLMEELCTKWYKMGPDDPLAALWYAWPLVWNNKRDEAIKFIDDTIRQRSFLIEIEYMKFLKFALQGNKSKALESISEETKNYSWDDLDGSWLTADLYALIDEREQALDWIEHIIDMGFINYPLFSDIDPFLENIREEPRFKKLMKRVKHEWENFEV